MGRMNEGRKVRDQQICQPEAHQYRHAKQHNDQREVRSLRSSAAVLRSFNPVHEEWDA